MKKILILVMMSFLMSCGSIEITSQSKYDMTYDNYNYNSIHSIYLNNPRFFYDNIYMDTYGIERYYHRHPHYIRYCKERARKIERRNNHHNIRNNNRLPTRRTYQITDVRRKHKTIRPSTRSNPKVIKRTPIKRSSTRNRRN